MAHRIIRKLLPSRVEVHVLVNGKVIFTTEDRGASSLVAYLYVSRGVLTDDVLYEEVYPADMIAANEVPVERLRSHLFSHGDPVDMQWFIEQIKLILKSPLDPPGTPPTPASAEDFVGVGGEDPSTTPAAEGKKAKAPRKAAPVVAAPPPSAAPPAGNIPSTCAWPADPILGRASGGDMAVVEVFLPREIDYRDPRAVTEWCKRRGYSPLTIQSVRAGDIAYWRATFIEPSRRPPGVAETVAFARNVRATILRTPSVALPAYVANANLDSV